MPEEQVTNQDEMYPQLEDEPETDFDQENYEAIKALVERKTVQFDELREQVKQLNESIANILINDNSYSELKEANKITSTAVGKRKMELMSSPEAVSTKLKLQEVKEDLSDIADSLSTQLLSLYQLTGVQEFETTSGDVREYVIKARIKGRRSGTAGSSYQPVPGQISFTSPEQKV